MGFSATGWPNMPVIFFWGGIDGSDISVLLAVGMLMGLNHGGWSGQTGELTTTGAQVSTQPRHGDGLLRGAVGNGPRHVRDPERTERRPLGPAPGDSTARG